MTEEKAFYEMMAVMMNVSISPINGKPVPVRNCTKQDCYDALYKIQDILFQVSLHHMIEAAKAIDLKKIFGEGKEDISENIQHVGYDDEQCGRTK